MYTTSVSPLPVNIFIAPGFEEEFVVQCVAEARRVGIQTGLVGINLGEVVGANGVGVCPNYSLDDLDEHHAAQVITLPGGIQSVNRWIVEPRLFRIAQAALDGGGALALAEEAQRLLGTGIIRIRAFHSQNIILQGNRGNGDFISQLIQFVRRESADRLLSQFPAIAISSTSTSTPAIPTF